MFERFKHQSEDERVKAAKERLEAERLIEEGEKANEAAAKAMSEALTEEEIEAGLERAKRGRKSGTYKDPNLGDQEKIAA